MTSEIICSLIALGGTVISALIAYFVSRSTANKELEKLKLTWEREDLVSSDDEFAEMAAAVAKFVQRRNYGEQRNALSSVAAIRSKETGEMAELLDSLYRAVRDWNPKQIDALLTQVIEKKREAKGHANSAHRNKPKKK